MADALANLVYLFSDLASRTTQYLQENGEKTMNTQSETNVVFAMIRQPLRPSLCFPNVLWKVDAPLVSQKVYHQEGELLADSQPDES